jgi:hypothetical protein
MAVTLHDRWQRDDYVIVRGLFDAPRVARLREICEAILAQWRACDPQTGRPGATPDVAVMRHLNHPAYFGGHSAWFDEVVSAITASQVLDVLREIFREEPVFRCTSLLFNPAGSRKDGDWHRDAQFVFPDEAGEKEMVLRGGDVALGVQTQIALIPSEDLELVPGSCRRWDTPGEYAIRKGDGGARNRSADMPGAYRVRLEPGDAVLFNPLGIHRGRYHADKLRRTLMLSYTKASQPWRDQFCDQPWFLDPGYMQRIPASFRPFFETFVEQYRDYWLRPRP